MTNLILLLMVAFGVGHTAYGQYLADGTSAADLIRNVVLVVVGGLGLALTNLESIGKCWEGRKNRTPAPQHPKPAPTPEPQLTDHPELADFLALINLRDKFLSLGSKEGVESVTKLVEELFKNGGLKK